MPLNEKQKGIFCGVVFQLVWFICIFCPIYVVIASMLGFLLVYVQFISKRRKDFIFALALAGVGLAVDMTWMKIGVFQMPTVLPPPWLAILWFAFSLSLPYAFYFLREQVLFSSVLGGLGGGFSYLSAISFRPDVKFGISSWLALVCIGFLWSILFPVALYIWQRYCPESATSV